MINVNREANCKNCDRILGKGEPWYRSGPKKNLCDACTRAFDLGYRFGFGIGRRRRKPERPIVEGCITCTVLGRMCHLCKENKGKFMKNRRVGWGIQRPA